MSIIPASRLSSSDLALLGNNVLPASRHRPVRNYAQQRRRSEIAAVNRSLAAFGESVGKLQKAILSLA